VDAALYRHSTLQVTMDEQGMVPDALRRVLKSAGGRVWRCVIDPTGVLMC